MSNDCWKFTGSPSDSLSARSEARRVDRVDPEGACGQVEAPEVVGVADELGDDLAEPERHDREVIAAEAQRREPDEDAGKRGHAAREQEDDPEVDVDAAEVGGDPGRAKMDLHLLEVARGEPAARVRPDCVERHVPEVEQAAVADDDVEADGHHDEDDHDHRRADAREVLDDRDGGRQAVVVDGVEGGARE